MTIIPMATDLRINGKSHALNVDKDGLRFSWQIPLTLTQTAYRLVFANSTDELEAQDYLFDTGWIDSAQSAAVTAEGLASALDSGHAYVWQVGCMYDTRNKVPFYSAPCLFTTAPNLTDTLGLWSENIDGKHDLFMFARHEFSLSRELFEDMTCAVLTVTATSPEAARQYVYLAYVNGSCVGVGPTRYGKDMSGNVILYHQAYDVTSLLSAGQNCLSAICYALTEQAFFCTLTVYNKHGEPVTLCHSGRDMAAWRVMGGDKVFRPDASIGTHYFVAHANNIDGALYPFGFAEAGFDDSGWTVPENRGDLGERLRLLPCPSEIMTRYPVPCDEITVKKTAEGDYLIDIGREIVGGLGLHIPCEHPMTLTLMYGEELLDPNHVRYQMRTGNVYREVWDLPADAPYVENLSMMTYRYVQISGCASEITADMVRPLSLRGAFDENVSYFESSSHLLNDIYNLTKHTVKVTTQDLYVDAQSRERMAYEGDLLINQLSAYAFSPDLCVARFTAEYLITHRTWPAEYPLFTVMGAWLDYMASGDDGLIATYYPALRDTVVKYAPDPAVGLVRHVTSAMSTTDGLLVDWPLSERDGYDMALPFNTVFNACVVGAYGALARMAELLGHTDDALAFGDVRAALTRRMIEVLYDPTVGGFSDGCDASCAPSSHMAQHATAFALAFDIYASPHMARAMAEHLRSTSRIRMSVYGAFFLLSGLYRSGHGDIATELMLSEDVSENAHTWAAMLYSVGATVTTEAWHPVSKPNMTHAHPWGSAPAHLITSGILGVTPTSHAYATFDVRPCPHGLTSASGRIPTVKGDIGVEFTRHNGILDVVVAVPGNTVATLYLPAPENAVIMLDGVSLSPLDYDRIGDSVALTLTSRVWEVTVEEE